MFATLPNTKSTCGGPARSKSGWGHTRNHRMEPEPEPEPDTEEGEPPEAGDEGPAPSWRYSDRSAEVLVVNGIVSARFIAGGVTEFLVRWKTTPARAWARVESSWEPYSNLGTDGQRLAMEYLRLEELAQALEKVYHAVEAMRVPDVRLEELENRPVVTRSKSF